MKKLWNMLRGKARRDDKGMTFVEVLCAVAILALVAGVIGTVIVVSTRTYRRGISETGIQQEAQLAANNIGNLVKDACSVVYGESGQQFLENGEKLMVNPDSTPKMQTDGKTELSIITNEKKQYTVTYQKTEPSNPSNPLGRLLYQEFDTSGNAGDLQIMANNVTEFTADTTDFKNSRTIKLNMTVVDKATNREIPMNYTMTSRNDAIEGAEYVSHTDNVSILFPDSEIVLVPGETYKIPLVVSGTLTEGGLEWESTGGLTGVGDPTLDYAEVTVPVETTATEETIAVHTKDKDGDGNYKATASCKVIIRRVTEVKVSHATDNTNSEGGMYETAGTKFTFTASVSGNKLEKQIAYDYDNNYKTAQAVAWSCVLKLNGTEDTYEWTSAQNGDGVWEFTAPDFTAGAFAQYFEVDTAATKEDALVPSFVIKTKETMPAGLELTVRATSKHALGVNKANSKYYDGLGSDPVNIYYGEDKIKPRETKLNQGLEITLEPHETGEVAVGMKGGVSNNVTFDFHDATDVRSDANPNGTTAVYNETNDTVEITLGKDEKGSGKTGTVPYTFTVDVKVDDVVKTTITVHVCRIDELSIAIIDNFTDKDGGLMNLPTYDFRARFNVDNGSISDMQNVVKNLIQYKPDGTVDEEAVKKTLSSKITWELIDHGDGSKVVKKDSVICMAGVGEKGETIGNYTKKYKKDKKVLYEIVHVKPARIEKDGSGNWYIKQLPEIDISPSADTPTGLLKNYELKVTIEALHPLGTENSKSYNKTGKLYKEGVEASASIFGDMTISAPAQLVIVEPGQGINSKEQSDKEMVIPISVGGVAVYSMSATLKEKSSSDTQLAVYPGGNPYHAEGATSAGNKRTWYLGLLIGKDEVGNHAGRIKVHVDAYNTSKEIVASTDFELGVRRVNEVDVKLSGKINEVNKTDGTMTLTASPSGCGNDGTEFYDMQKDDGKTCRWEQSGHGEYKEPSQMEWKMLLKGGDKPKPLSECTEYIATDTIKTSVDKENHKATVSFKLKQPLPNGTKIRAYSLHAHGSNGKDEAAADYVKYNKSGKEYDEVYGELAIRTGNWKRGGTVNITDWLPQEVFYTDEEGRTGWANSDGTGIDYGTTVNLTTNFYTKYMQSTGNNLAWTSTFNISLWSSSIGGDRAFSKINVTNSDVSTAAATLSTEEEWLKKSAYSSAYPMDDSAWWIDMNKVHLETTINGKTYGQDYDIQDVVFQYRNSLPDVSTGNKKGDNDGAWTQKKSNTLVVYVTPDDTISTYDSYYKLSEGWEETYEQYTCLPDRYVGVVSSSERMTDFTVTNTTGTGSSLGRSYVSFAFDKDARTDYVGKTVKMIYEYNPYFCNTSGWQYGQYKAEELASVDGCEGILEFHFVNANIDGSVTGPKVRYCPTYAENGGEYYYISKNARFKLSSDGTTAYYQTSDCDDTTSSLTSNNWTTVCTMTYSNGTWN